VTPFNTRGLFKFIGIALIILAVILAVVYLPG